MESSIASYQQMIQTCESSWIAKKRSVMFQFYPKFLAITITLKTWKNKSVEDMAF
jgi:hypothetical protein